jgi:sulfoxide reductase heme-binding subunit YedZ
MTDLTQTPGRKLRDQWLVVWVVLAIPAVVMAGIAVVFLLQHGIRGLKAADLLRWTGIVSCVLLIVTLSVTPLSLMTRGGFRWLRTNRRYLGVASFCYAALHLGYWLLWTHPAAFLRSFVRVEVLTGWIGFFIMAIMAWTSTDAAMRRMGPKWKALQRWVYLAAVLVFLHWLLTAETTQRHAETLILSAPIIALSIWRFGFRKRAG